MPRTTRSRNALPRPPIATSRRDATEILRVWTGPGLPIEVSLETNWQDPATWGLLLADIARHAANAYVSEGCDLESILLRIRHAFEAEWSAPTDSPIELR